MEEESTKGMIQAAEGRQMGLPTQSLYSLKFTPSPKGKSNYSIM